MAFVQPPRTLNRILAVKLESEQGVDASPSVVNPNTDTISTHTELNFIQFQARRIQVPTAAASMTKLKDIIGAKTRPVSFQKHLNFTGDGTMPDWVKLVRMCGYSCASGSSGGSSSWVLTPRSTGFESGTFLEHAEDIRKKSLGAIGTFTVDFPAGNPPNFSFTFLGENDAETAVTFPTSVDFPPNVVRQVESAVLAIAGFTPIAPSIRFDSGGANQPRDDVNSPDGIYAYFYADRQPLCEIVMEVPLLGSHDFYTAVVDATDTAISWQVGSNALGSKTVFSIPTAQPIPYNYGDRNGVRILTQPYHVQSSTPNGEVTITHYESLS